jgi:asparagine synthase (glutamine-hydrolysing)
MSGICAVFRKRDVDRTCRTLAALCEGTRLEASTAISTLVEGNAGVGAASRFSSQQVYRTSEVLVACDAELYDPPSLEESAGVPAESGVAAQLASLYTRFGTDFLSRLRGEYAVIIWDARKRRLLAATDCFGIHPLVYYEDANVLLVATRIEALLASGEVPRDIRPSAIANYLNYTVNLAPGTILTGVNRLLPGHFLQSSGGPVTTHKHWDMQYTPAEASEEELCGRLENVVQEAVRTHSQATSFATVGAFLSGGTDSSTVTGMMNRLGRGQVKTFSIGFEEERFNELEYARIAARAFQTDHHEYLVSAADCADALPNMIRYFDEPFGNSSAIPTYFCARLAAQNGVQTLLAGDGGDELFAGNERYLTNRLFDRYHYIPRFARKGLIEPLLGVLPFRNGILGMARSYVRRSNLPQPDRFFSYNLLLDNPVDAIFEPDFVRSLGSSSVLQMPTHYYWNGPANEELNRLLYLDVKITLGDNDLLKVTRMSELAGVKSRFPLMDRAVAEFAGTIPTALQVKGNEKRYLFKRALRNLLPAEILQKKKHGFGIPVAVWMKSKTRLREIARDTLLSPQTYQRGIVKRSFVEELFRLHETDETAFYGDILWTFLALELWFRQSIDQPRKAVA